MRSTVEYSGPPQLPGRLARLSGSFLFLLLNAISECPAWAQERPLFELVNPFIGTGGHGHTYPGVSTPFGMVQLSPDTRLDGWDGCSGYHFSDKVIYGFSHTHLSGTGVADYCDILIMPFTGNDKWENGSVNGVINGYGSKFSHSFEKTDAGFYSVHLDDDDIDVALTTTQHCGYHQIIYSGNSTPKLIIDLEHRDKLIDSDLLFANDSLLVGRRISSSWATEQHIYFAIKLSQLPVRKQFWKEAESEKPTKLILEFDPAVVQLEVKVGVSAVDIKGAVKNLEAELPGWDFQWIRHQNEQAWQTELGKIRVYGKNPDDKRIFYTALYHSFLAPNTFSDCDGRYRGMDNRIYSSNHTVYSVFSLWDTFRALHPLFTIVQQKRTSEMISTMLSHYRTSGMLPIWELAANETKCMIGNHAISVITDAYVKGLRGFNSGNALLAMVHSATRDHLGLLHYKNHGFISSEDESESVSKTLEYAYNDWCIAVLADSLNQPDLAEIFYKRSQSWKNLFNSESKFMEPRFNGGWKSTFRPEEVTFDYTEANAWQYSLFVPHDVNTLVNFMGGPQELENWLDRLFTAPSQTSGREQADISGLIGQYAHGNEPSHHMAYLYNFTGHPSKTQYYVHKICQELYLNQPDGLCGNEDCGQMSAWYVFSSMGFYPVTPGSENYLLGTPLFDSVSIQLENGKVFRIQVENLTEENFYVRRVMLNGKILARNYIRHAEIISGGVLIFEMSNSPSSVATSPPPCSVPGDQLLPAPWTLNSESHFEGRRKVLLESVPGSEIHYTLNGTEPDLNSPLYERPLVLKKTTDVQFRSFDKHVSGFVARSTFRKSQHNWTIRLNSEYQNQYSGGGRLALIDGQTGGTDFRTGRWQGYLDRDVDAIINLKKKTEIKAVYLSCLQDVGSWIWFPKDVQIMISNNGKNWFTVATALNQIAPDKYGGIVQKIGVEKSFKTRYLRIVARNFGRCPDWHPGAGKPSHIFADEIIIETVK